VIDKLLELKGLGVLRDALPNGAVGLAKCTVIYGENGRGKTTLARLLTSLSTGDCTCLGPMQTIGYDASPCAGLLVSRSQYSLRRSSWTPQPLPSVVVFDSDFVRRNVYTGTSVNPGHRRNLCSFALGEEGVALADKVERLNDEIKGTTRKIGEVERGLSQLAGGLLTIDGFLELVEDPEIDARVAEAQKLVQAALDAGPLQTARVLTHLPNWSAPTPEDAEVLTQSLDGVATDAAEKTRRHVEERLGSGGEEWLRIGLRYLRDEHCPFCGQGITGSELVEAFRGYFGQAYAELRQRVDECAGRVEAACSELLLQQMRTVIAENEAAAEFWAKYLSVPELSSPLGGVDAAMSAARSGLLPAFQRKKADLLSPAEPDMPSEELQERLRSAVLSVEAYNQTVDQANETIERSKTAASTSSLREADSALKRLQLQQRRWEPEISGACTELLRLRQVRQEQEELKDEAKRGLYQYMSRTMVSYRAAVNGFLAKCSTAFKIAEMDVGFAGGEPRADFSIELFGYRASVASRATDGPHFDTMLSDGDRRTLAFAFFLARLDCDPSLAGRTVVLDDPVASLDTHRTSCTVEAITGLSRRCGQLIVLTHDPAFAMATSDALAEAGMGRGGQLSVLRLARDGEWSTICACDADELCKTVLERSIEVLEDFVCGPSHVAAIDAVKSIRPAVEGLLRLKYPREFRGARDFGAMANRIRDAAEGTRLHRLAGYVEELHAVCSYYATSYMHVERPHTQAVPGDAEALSWIERALELVDVL